MAHRTFTITYHRIHVLTLLFGRLISRTNYLTSTMHQLRSISRWVVSCRMANTTALSELSAMTSTTFVNQSKGWHENINIRKKRRIHKIYKNTRHPAHLTISKQVKAEVKHSKIQFETKLAENIKEDKKNPFSPISEVKQKQIHIQDPY